MGSTDVYNYSYSNVHTSAGLAFEYGKGELCKLSSQIGYGTYFIRQPEWITFLSIGVTLDFSLNSK
jgi:hypothetical protein